MIVDGSYPVAEQGTSVRTRQHDVHVTLVPGSRTLCDRCRIHGHNHSLRKQFPLSPTRLHACRPGTAREHVSDYRYSGSAKSGLEHLSESAAGRFQWQNLPAEAASFRLVDPQGRVVINSREFRDRAVDLSGLPAGMYFIWLMNEKEQEIGQKVLILQGK